MAQVNAHNAGDFWFPAFFLMVWRRLWCWNNGADGEKAQYANEYKKKNTSLYGVPQPAVL